MKLDYLGGTDFLIDQGEEFYRMNSDTELLGRFIRIKHQQAKRTGWSRLVSRSI